MVIFLDQIGMFDDKKSVDGWKFPKKPNDSFLYFMKTASNIKTGGKMKIGNGNRDLVSDPMTAYLSSTWYVPCVKFMANKICTMTDQKKKDEYLQCK